MKKLNLILLILLLNMGVFSISSAQVTAVAVKSSADVSLEHIQSLFIYNFTKHIKWPTVKDNFTIGVFGESAIINELNSLMKDKKIDGKPIVVKSIGTPEEAGICQMVYIPKGKSKQLPALTTTVAKDVLIVTESDMIAQGAGISFFSVDAKLKFKINEEMLAKGGLQVAGNLLSLAER
jgi:hypothetical protein